MESDEGKVLAASNMTIRAVLWIIDRPRENPPLALTESTKSDLEMFPR